MKECVCGGHLKTTTALSTPSTASSERSREAIRTQWPVFAEAILSRLDKGAVEYGDKSFDADSVTLLDEIEEELLDVIGWAFPLFCRIQKLKAKIATVERACASV